MAVGQNQWYHFGVGAPPILVYFSGDWDVHWGYGILTHNQMIKCIQDGAVDVSTTTNVAHPKTARLHEGRRMAPGKRKQNQPRYHCLPHFLRGLTSKSQNCLLPLKWSSQKRIKSGTQEVSCYLVSACQVSITLNIGVDLAPDAPAKGQVKKEQLQKIRGQFRMCPERKGNRARAATKSTHTNPVA